ncbi:MAG: YceD family protein [Polaromonas sp.]|nr:YceD family protein [Polaromonas sp.]
MSSSLQANRLNLPALAREGVPLIASIPLQKLKRIAKETQGLQPDSSVYLEARAEFRPNPGADDVVWLHLQAETSLLLTCQRCTGAVLVLLKVDQWYRFVATEDIAMAEDDQSEEDLLVLEPQFDLLALLEDELLMALPLVPMHDACPVAPTLSVGDADIAGESGAKPNAFAALAQLRRK